MAIALICPTCHRSFDVPDFLVGKTMRCANCSSQLAIGASDSPIVEAHVVQPGEKNASDSARASSFYSLRTPSKHKERSTRDDHTRVRRSRKSNNLPLLVGLSVLGGLVLLCVTLGFYFAFTGRMGSVDRGSAVASAKAAGWAFVDEPLYSCYMPKAPQRSGGQGSPTLQMCTNEDDSYVYLVMSLAVADIPELRGQAKPPSRLVLETIKAQSHQPNAKFGTLRPGRMTSTDITQDGFPGIEVTNEMDDRGGTGMSRVVVVGDHVVIAGVGGRGMKPGDSRVRTFLTSLKIKGVPATESPVETFAVKPLSVSGQSLPPSPRDAADSSWQPVTNAEGFEAEMPGPASRVLGSKGSGKGRWQLRQPGQVFSISHGSLYSSAGSNQALDFAVRSYRLGSLPELASMGLRFSNETDISLGNIPGRQLTFTSATPNVEGVVRIYLDGQRRFTLIAAGENLGPASETVKRFFDSFRPAAFMGNTIARSRPFPNSPSPVPGGSDPIPSVPPAVPLPIPAVPAPEPPMNAPPITATIEPFWAVAVHPSRNEVFTVGGRVAGTAIAQKAAGMLRRYSYPDFKLKGTYQLPYLASEIVVDEARGLLYTASLTKAETLVLSKLDFDRVYGDGMVQVFDLKAIQDGKVQEREDVKPMASISTSGKPVAITLAPDGQWLYCLTEFLQVGVNAGYRSKLLRIDTTKRSIEKEMTLPEPTRDMIRSADGRKLFLTEWPVSANNLPILGKAAGVFVVDTATWTKLPSFRLPGLTFDLAISTRDQLVASLGQAERNVLLTLNDDGRVPEEIKSMGACQNGYIQFTPDSKTLVASSVYGRGGVDLYDVSDASSPAGFTLRISYSSSEDTSLSGYFRLTPDGRRALFNSGVVLELAPTK